MANEQAKGKRRQVKGPNRVNYTNLFFDGFWKQNPIFVLLLGLCPTLAVTNTIDNAVGLGVATLFVMICSSLLISLIRKWIYDEVRIPSFIVIIATFVTVASLLMEAYTPGLFLTLGIFIPLIVVNCIVLGRVLSVAYHTGPGIALVDAVGTGFGFTLGLVVIGAIRELLGTGGISLFGNQLFASNLSVGIMVLPPGALITVGLLIAGKNYLDDLKTEKNSKQKHTAQGVSEQ